jgi:hypothetical protein
LLNAKTDSIMQILYQIALGLRIMDTVTNLGHHFVTCSSTFNKGNGFLSAMV